MLKLSGRTSDPEHGANKKICIGGARISKGKHLRTRQSFYCANTKDCIAKTRFSTDYNFFLVSECKVGYQRSHKWLCRATAYLLTAGGHIDVLTF